MSGKSFLYIKRKYPARRVFSFFICLIISAFLWLINALNRSYTRTIAIPVKFVNYPLGKRLVNKQPPYIMADIRTSGAKLLMLLVKKSIGEITIDVSKATNARQATQMASISTVNSIGNLSKLLNVDVDLIKLKPDSIHFVFGKTVTKMVYVKPQVQVNYTIPQGIYKKIKVSPAFIQISADSATLAKIDTLYTEKIVLNNLNQKVEQQTAIQLSEELEGMVALSSNSVNLQINLDEFAQKKMQIPVEVMHQPANCKLKTFPAFVEVTLALPFKQFDSLTEEMVKAQVDFRQTGSQTEKLSVTVSSTLIDSKVTEISPKKVEYVIRKQ